MLAIPLHRFVSLDPALLAGKVVVDTMNYWPPVDGVQAAFEDRRYGSSEIVQHRLADSTVVKTLNHIGYHELDEDRRPPGDRRIAARWASPVTTRPRWTRWPTSSTGSATTRSALDRLRDGRLLEPGGPVFGISLRRDEFESRHRYRGRRARPLTNRRTDMTTASGQTTVDTGMERRGSRSCSASTPSAT